MHFVGVLPDGTAVFSNSELEIRSRRLIPIPVVEMYCEGECECECYEAGRERGEKEHSENCDGSCSCYESGYETGQEDGREEGGCGSEVASEIHGDIEVVWRKFKQRAESFLIEFCEAEKIGNTNLLEWFEDLFDSLYTEGKLVIEEHE